MGPIVLVPLDGSALAEGALWVAARVARGLRAVLHLVSVRTPEADGPDTGQRDLREYLATKADEVATTHGVRCECAVLHGWPPEAVARHAGAVGGCLVVLTAHGRSGVSRSWIGSTTEGVLARAQVPVLVLRPGLGPPRARFDHVLVAMDQSAGAATVLKQALLLGAAERPPAYTLAQVLEPRTKRAPKPDETHDLERRMAEATRMLERAASRLRKRGLAVTTQVVVGANAADLLMELGRALKCDVIAIGSQSRHPTARLPLGKVADKVLRGAAQPILIVPVAREAARRVARPRRPRAGVRRRHPA